MKHQFLSYFNSVYSALFGFPTSLKKKKTNKERKEKSIYLDRMGTED